MDDELIEEQFTYQTATNFFEFEASAAEINVELRHGDAILFSNSYSLEQLGSNATFAFTGVFDPDAFEPNPDGTDTAFRAVIFGRNIIPGGEYRAEYRTLHAVTNAPAVSRGNPTGRYNPRCCYVCSAERRALDTESGTGC